MQFTCPYCGLTLDVAPQFVGQTGPCANCGKTVTITPPIAATKSSTIWWIVIPIAIVLLLVGGGAYVFMTGLSGAREAARRSQCTNNLKHLGLAMHNHHDRLRMFPPAYIAEEDGKPLHSWRVLLLPYIEEQALFDQIRLNEPWDSPHNRQFHNRMPEVYRCPSAGQDRSKGLTNYMVVVDDKAKDAPSGRTLFGPGRLIGKSGYEGGSSFGAIKDGTSNTILVVEVAGSTTNWMEPRDLQFDEQVTVNTTKDGSCLSSEHREGVNVLMADGSVKFLREDLAANTLKKQLTHNDSQSVD